MRSRKWRQLVADICNLPVTVYHQDEGAAFGAALQAMQLLEPGSDIAQLADANLTQDAERSCEPRKAAVKHYRESYAQYQRAVDAVTTLYS